MMHLSSCPVASSRRRDFDQCLLPIVRQSISCHVIPFNVQDASNCFVTLSVKIPGHGVPQGWNADVLTSDHFSIQASGTEGLLTRTLAQVLPVTGDRNTVQGNCISFISQTKKQVRKGKHDEPRVTQCEVFLLVLLTITTCSIKMIFGKTEFVFDMWRHGNHTCSSTCAHAWIGGPKALWPQDQASLPVPPLPSGAVPVCPFTVAPVLTSVRGGHN